MNCQKCKKLISEYLEENLDSSQKQLFEEHISSCRECEKELNEFLDSWDLLGDYSTPDPAEDFTQKVIHKIHERKTIQDTAQISLWEKFIAAFTLKNVGFLPGMASLMILAALGFALLRGGSTGVKHQPEISNAQKTQIVRNVQDEEIIRNLEIYQNVEMLENLDVLIDLETLEKIEEENLDG